MGLTKGGMDVDDRQFDNLSRRIAELPLPRLPRRGLMALLGSWRPEAPWSLPIRRPLRPRRCRRKEDDQKCDKKKCKKKNKKCCCEAQVQEQRLR